MNAAHEGLRRAERRLGQRALLARALGLLLLAPVVCFADADADLLPLSAAAEPDRVSFDVFTAQRPASEEQTLSEVRQLLREGFRKYAASRPLCERPVRLIAR